MWCHTQTLTVLPTNGWTELFCNVRWCMIVLLSGCRQNWWRKVLRGQMRSKKLRAAWSFERLFTADLLGVSGDCTLLLNQCCTSLHCHALAQWHEWQTLSWEFDRCLQLKVLESSDVVQRLHMTSVTSSGILRSKVVVTKLHKTQAEMRSQWIFVNWWLCK